jgi:hypothetical protein
MQVLQLPELLHDWVPTGAVLVNQIDRRNDVSQQPQSGGRMSVALKSYAIVLLLASVVPSGCRGSQFSGDGEMIDRGYLSWIPRYILELRPSAVADGGEHNFRLAGMPRDSMNLTFRLPDNITAEQVRRTGDRISMSLESQSGAVLCAFAGPIAAQKIQEQRSAPIEVWNPACLDLKFDPGADSRLTVNITPGSPDFTVVSVIPRFEGGGWDSP